MGKAYDDLRYYFERGAETRSEVFGRGCAALGLAEGRPVDLATFQALRGGIGPNGERLRGEYGREGSRDRATDWVMSPPKSVSIVALVLGDAGAVAAHREAVQAAARVIEEQVTAWVQGGTARERTGIGLGAIFEHESSRAADPQLHSHIVLLNSTLRADGQWRAVDDRPQFQAQQLAKAVYLRELSAGLERQGWRLVREGNGTFEIAGIDRRQTEAFSRRRQEILAAVQKMGATDTTTRRGAIARAMAAIFTRDEKAPAPREALLEDWRERGRALGLPDLAELRRLNQSIGDRIGPVPSPVTADEAIDRAIEHLTERRASFRRLTLEAEAYSRADQAVTLEEVRAGIDDRIGLPKRDLRRLVAVRDWVTTMEAVGQEDRILALWGEGREAAAPIAPEPNSHWPVGMSREQRVAIDTILGAKDRVLGFVGPAGTGKSTVLQQVVGEAQRRGWCVRALAPTHKATGVFEKDGLAARTLASFLSDPASGTPGERELWVVDEAGLVGTNTMLRLLEKARTIDARVLLVGDPRQLQAVEAGQPFADLLREGMATASLSEIRRQRNPALLQVARAASRGEVGEALDALSKCGAVREYCGDRERLAAATREYERMRRSGRSVLLVTTRNEDRHAFNHALHQGRLDRGEIAEAGYTGEVLVRRDLTREQRGNPTNYRAGDIVLYTRCSYEVGVRAGQRGSVAAVGRKEIAVRLDNGKEVRYAPRLCRNVAVYEKSRREWCVGERVEYGATIDRERGLVNGTTATILALDPESGVALLRLDKGERAVEADLSKPEALDYGYASTLHKGQGRTVDGVVWLGRAVDAERRGFYVALTRARDEAVAITDDAERLRELAKREREDLSARDVARWEREVENVERGSDPSDGARGDDRGPRGTYDRHLDAIVRTADRLAQTARSRSEAAHEFARLAGTMGRIAERVKHGLEELTRLLGEDLLPWLRRAEPAREGRLAEEPRRIPTPLVPALSPPEHSR